MKWLIGSLNIKKNCECKCEFWSANELYFDCSLNMLSCVEYLGINWPKFTAEPPFKNMGPPRKTHRAG